MELGVNRTFACLKSVLCFVLDKDSGLEISYNHSCSQIKKADTLLSTKSIENAYFDQRLECAAPKLWSKYTTGKVITSLNFLSNKNEDISSSNRIICLTSGLFMLLVR